VTGPHNLEVGLLPIMLFSTLRPKGGGTLLAAGSHRVSGDYTEAFHLLDLAAALRHEGSVRACVRVAMRMQLIARELLEGGPYGVRAHDLCVSGAEYADMHVSDEGGTSPLDA
jgi:hypothetical protein